MARTVYSILAGRDIEVADEEYARLLAPPPSAAPQSAELLDALTRNLTDLEQRATRAEQDAVTQRQEAQRLTAELARAPQPVTVAGTPTPPADLELLPMRDGAGLLSRVTLRAAGYGDTHVDVVRGTDSRMRALKVVR